MSRIKITLVVLVGVVMVFGVQVNQAEAAAPNPATLVSPSGTIYETTPTYTWNAVADSTWYHLWVNDFTGTVIDKWYRAAEADCGDGTGTCSVTPTTELFLGSARWWIQTWNNDGTGPWSSPMPFTVAEGFSEASIQGEYAFTAMEQGGGVGITGDTVPSEAAMGIVAFDGAGNFTGKVTWNMYDIQDQVPNSDRLVFHRFPFTGTYTVEGDGFGTANFNIDFDLDGNIDLVMTGKLFITKATSNKEATEAWFIADDTTFSVGGGLPLIRIFKR